MSWVRLHPRAWPEGSGVHGDPCLPHPPEEQRAKTGRGGGPKNAEWTATLQHWVSSWRRAPPGRPRRRLPSVWLGLQSLLQAAIFCKLGLGQQRFPAASSRAASCITSSGSHSGKGRLSPWEREREREGFPRPSWPPAGSGQRSADRAGIVALPWPAGHQVGWGMGVAGWDPDPSPQLLCSLHRHRSPECESTVALVSPKWASVGHVVGAGAAGACPERKSCPGAQRSCPVWIPEKLSEASAFPSIKWTNLLTPLYPPPIMVEQCRKLRRREGHRGAVG